MSSERRREPRYPYRLPITLTGGGVAQETLTEDVSHRGLFAITDRPPALRQLIQVKASLPDSTERFHSHAMSVFVIERGNSEGRTPGCGLQFYAMAEPIKRVWGGFIDSVRRERTRAAQWPRQHVRYRIKLAVRPRSLDELYELYTRDVSRGGMFLLTGRSFELGEELGVDVVHPVSGEVFSLECSVRRLEPGPPAGIGVQLKDIDESGRAAFLEFVHSAIPEVDADELDLVEEDDPRLA